MRVLLRRKAIRRDDRGAVTLIVTFCMVALCICAALVTDFGMAYVNKRQAQTAADAAVMAAGKVFSGKSGTCPSLIADPTLMSSAETAADQLRLANLPGSPNVDLVPSCATGALTLDYHVSINSPLGLGQIVSGTDHLTVDREAQSSLKVVTTIVGACSLCFLGNGTTDTGNADYSVTNGSIHLNGNLSAGPNGMWTVTPTASQKIGVTGTVSGGQYSPAYVTEPVIPDPLASMSLPLSTTGLSAKSDPCNDGPGIYGAVELKGTCSLSAGAYVITGAWTMKNNTTLTSSGGVTLYFKSANGMLDAKNGVIAGLKAPTGAPTGAPVGWPSGFAIIYDRDNTNVFSAQGNGNTTITGAIYGRSATIEFNGTSDFHFVGGPIVVKSGTGNGNQGTVYVESTGNVGGVPQTNAGTMTMSK